MNNIKDIMDKKGISIRKLSIDLEMEYAQAHRLVNKKDLSNIQVSTLFKVSEYLGVTVEEIYKNK